MLREQRREKDEGGERVQFHHEEEVLRLGLEKTVCMILWMESRETSSSSITPP